VFVEDSFLRPTVGAIEFDDEVGLVLVAEAEYAVDVAVVGGDHPVEENAAMRLDRVEDDIRGIPGIVP